MKLAALVRGRRLCLVAVFLAPALAWLGLVTLVSTEGARREIETRLEKATRRKVALGGVHIGLLGGVHLADLRVGTATSVDDPWLRAGEVDIDVHLFELLRGRVEPSNIAVRDARLRVLRRADGSLELAEFLARSDDSPAREGNDDPDAHDVRFTLDAGEIILTDEPTGTRLRLRGVQGRAVRRGKLVRVEELRGEAGGGTIVLDAQVDRGGAIPEFEGHLVASDLSLAETRHVLTYLVPLFAGAPRELDARASLDVYLRGQHGTAELLRRSTVGQGVLILDPICLDGSRFLDEVARIVELPPEGRVGTIRAPFVIKDGRIASDALTVDVARVPVVLAGWTDFDGRVSYRLRAETLADRLPARAREFLEEMEIDLGDVVDVRVRGSVDAVEVTLDDIPLGNALDGVEDGPASERERLRLLTRRIRERMRK